MDSEKKYVIHPAVGIARVGDSPEELYIAPEIPGTFCAPTEIYKVVLQSTDKDKSEIHSFSKIDPPDYNYRDTSEEKRIRRQAARFKIFEYTPNAAAAMKPENPPIYPTDQEITTLDLTRFDVTWQVKLSNLKSPMGNNEPEAISLKVDPTQELVRLFDTPKLTDDDGTEQQLPRLGEIYTDTEGRLIVAGGAGEAKPVGGADPIEGNTNVKLYGWFDDTSDGVVTATIKDKNTHEEFEALAARIVIAPPKFGGDVLPLVSLYDLMEENSGVSPPKEVSYTEHIFPILQKVILMQWVSQQAFVAHGNGTLIFDFWAKLTTGSPQEQQDLRKHLLELVENHHSDYGDGRLKAFRGMPKLIAHPDKGPFLTKRQIALFRGWAAQNIPEPVPTTLPRPTVSEHTYLENVPVSEQPQALDQAHMETISSRGYLPGVDVGEIVESIVWKDENALVPRANINGKQTDGELTQTLATPWQVDIPHCGEKWWPTSYPSHVFRGTSSTPERYNEVIANYSPAPDASESRRLARLEGVTNWHNFGFVKRVDYISTTPSDPESDDDVSDSVLSEHATFSEQIERKCVEPEK